MGSDYLRNFLIPILLTHPTRSARGMLQMSLAIEFWLAGSRKRAFSVFVPALWNILSPEVRWAPNLLA